MAFSLALLGVYGVVAYATACRTQEFGLRIALGAQTGDILQLVVGHGLWMALAGVAVGVGLSLWLTRFLSSLLFGVKAASPLVHAGAAVLLTTAVLIATILPARRATRIDPVSALKYE
jgi:putative ABC transport system permease protein